MQLLFQPVLHDLRQRLAVQLMRPVVADVRELLIAVRYDRRALIRAHRRHNLNHISDQVGVRDHHFLRLVTAEIGKFFQHLLRGAKIQGRLIVRVRESLPRHNDAPVNLVLGIQEMHVAGSGDRLVELLSQPYNLPVDLHDILHGIYIRHPLRLNHKAVVAKRLYFQIVIKIHKPCDLRVGLFLQKRPVKLPRLAGAPQNQPLPVLRKQALGNPRSSGKISQMGLRYQTVKVHTPHIVLRENDRMVGRQLSDNIGTRFPSGIDLCKGCNSFLCHHGNQLHEDFRRRLRVVHRPMVVLQRHAKCLRHRVQRVLFLPGQKDSGDSHRVHIGKVMGNALPVAVFYDKTHVKLGIVRHQNTVAAKV